MRIGIVGSREYPKLHLVRSYVSKLDKDTVIISGGAAGVDKAAEEAAKEFGLETKIYLAEWETYGRRAGFLRNTQIVEDSEKIVAFWDESSRGTLDTLRKAIKAGREVWILGKTGHWLDIDSALGLREH